jgi:hypothetical protein
MASNKSEKSGSFALVLDKIWGCRCRLRLWLVAWSSVSLLIWAWPAGTGIHTPCVWLPVFAGACIVGYNELVFYACEVCVWLPACRCGARLARYLKHPDPGSTGASKLVVSLEPGSRRPGSCSRATRRSQPNRRTVYPRMQYFGLHCTDECSSGLRVSR